MGQTGSHAVTIDPNKIFQWDLLNSQSLCGNYYRSTIFNQEGENFCAFANKQTNSIIVYCCSAEQWHYDEMFSFQVQIFGNQQMLIAATTASFSKKYPLCLVIVSGEIPDLLYFQVKLSTKYPYTRKDRYLGIRNSGSTCYMASVLQILYHTTAFRNLIYSFQNPPDSVGSLQNLFMDLQLSSRAPSPDNFIRTLGSFNELSMVQHDAHEFLVVLLERLEADIGEKFKQGESSLFSGKTLRTIEVPTLDFKTTSEEGFTTMPIIVDGLKNLRESLGLITAPEILSDDYDTGEKGRAQATQSLCFVKLPPILSFQLCRFKYSTKKNTIIEIKTAFDCPFDLDMKSYCEQNYEGETNYELYGIIAHSGNPMYGHYTAFIRAGLGKQWIQFNDGSTKNVDESHVSRLFGTSTKSQPSFFRAFTFSSAVAYMCFYVRKDCQQFIHFSDHIPLHLAPHRSDLFFAKFVFQNEIIGSSVSNIGKSMEWQSDDVLILHLIQRIRPDFSFTKYFAWARMPGQADLIGPLSLDSPASTFVIKGLTTVFFIVQADLNSGPIFVMPKKSPKKCTALTTCERLFKDISEGQIVRYKSLMIKSDYFMTNGFIPPGSTVTTESQSRVFLSINDRRYIFSPNSSYADIQKRVSLLTSINPSNILFLNNSSPLNPQQYKYASQFPSAPITYQVLRNDVTACSISLFTPLSMICISSKFTNELLSPYWARKGTTVSELLTVAQTLFPGCRWGDKLHLVISQGTFDCAREILSARDTPKHCSLRVDVIRHKALKSVKKYKTYIKRGQTFSLEVRCAVDDTLEIFTGVSRFITITKTTTGRDLIKKMSNVELYPGEVAPDMIAFFNDKPKIRQDLDIDTGIFPVMNKLIANRKGMTTRIVIAIVSKSPLLNKPDNMLTRSLSGILNHGNK